MGGGKSKQSDIDKISSSTKKTLEKLVQSQMMSERRANKAQAKDLKLAKQQMKVQNQNTATMQNLYQQQLTQQQGVADQYSSGLQQQLDLLRQQNDQLQGQSTEQSAYFESLRQYQEQQNQLNLQQQRRAEEEAQYTSMVESQQATNAASQANRLTQQTNRRRALQRMR